MESHKDQVFLYYSKILKLKRQSKLFYVKKANTTHRLLSITVRGIHMWNGVASDITQLPSLQEFKKRLKSTLLASYL